MKNLKSVSALLVLALSISACEKNTELAIPSNPESQQRQGQVILPTFNLLPTEIRDASGNLEQQFTYNSKNQLTSLYTQGEDFLTFSYSTKGRLQKVIHFPNESESFSHKTTSTDLFIYKNDESKKPIRIMRYANGMNSNNELSTLNPTATIEIMYDNALNKLSEIEYTLLRNGLGKGIVKENRYTYDAKGNVTTIKYSENGVLKNTVQFKQFDNFKNMFSSIPVLNLMPFQTTGVNNATQIIGDDQPEKYQVKIPSDNVLKQENQILKSFTYNDFGFPETATTHVDDGIYTVNIKYDWKK